jgi:hypothetical protein
VIRLFRDKKINRKIASQKWFVTETGKALPQTGISPPEKIIEENTENVEESKGKKEQVVETTCGSHEKTSKDNFYKIRGSRPLD